MHIVCRGWLPPQALPHPRWDARTWSLLVVLCGVLFLDGLDVSMVGMALPSIRTELGLTTSQLQWVVSGYVLGYGGLLLLGGRAADLLGRRRVLIIGLVRVRRRVGDRRPRQRRHAARPHARRQGHERRVHRARRPLDHHHHVRGGPEPQPRARATTPPPARAGSRSASCSAACSPSSAGAGRSCSRSRSRWRSSFLARRVIPRDKLIPGERRRYDIAGAVTITAAMLLLVRTVVEAPEVGWGDPVTVGSFALVVGAAGRVRDDRAAQRRSRSSGSASCAPARWCAPTSAWRRCSAPTSASSSSARCTCRRCTAGRRSRPRSRSCPAASWSRSGRRGSGRSWTASARRG